ncbi:hypothetical protein JTB14_018820 [Gonioctena quinquepunctata]|nr:hypothetical protein JTB14_018820 [Gonioctena quinquepunctata]
MLDLIQPTKGTDIFEAVNKVVSVYGGFDKCSCIVTDGARAKEIPIFLKAEVKPNTTELENQIRDAQFLVDLAFFTDLTSHLNELNLKLQGKQQNVANSFGHPLTISVRNVRRTDLKLELCDLQSDPFCQGRTETRLDFFDLLPGRTVPQLAKFRAYTGLDTGKHVSLRKQLFQHEIY